MTTIAEPEHIPFDDGQQRPGSICAANESRFNSTYFSEPLTAFAVGWRDPSPLGELLKFIAPVVHVGRRFEFKKATNAEHFYTETDDVRAIGSAFKRIGFTGESVNEKTYNKGLTVRVDHDDEAGPDWRERYVQLLIQRLMRNELRRAIAAVDGAAAGSSKTWSSSANPDADVRAALTTATNASGIRPNRVIFGEGAWDIRADSYDAQDNAGAYRSASLDPDQLARKLLVDGVRILSARYQQTASAKAAVLGNIVYCYHAQGGAMKDEPSNIKRFLTPADGGDFRVYVDENAKYTDITVEHYSNIVITSDLGIRKLTISAS